MDYVMQVRIHDYVRATLRELGVAEPTLDASHTRLLTKDGYSAGQITQCGHIRVLFSGDGQRIGFYGPGDVLVREIAVAQIAA